MNKLRELMRPLRRGPLHPQWLVFRTGLRVDRLLQHARGLVLDVGCAEGWAREYLPPGTEYIGLDYYVTVRAMYATRPQIFGEARQLPLRDGAVETVLLLDVLEHVPDAQAALQEAARVLQPGGRVLISIPFVYPIHDAPYDFHRYTRYGLERLLGIAGLRVEFLSTRQTPAETAGLMACLAMADAAQQILKRRWWLVPLLPVLAVGILLTNLVAWLGGAILPASDFMPGSYCVVARRA